MSLININKIPADNYNYSLPPERIAAFPLPERDKSKLLIYVKNKPVVHDLFINLAKYIDKEHVVVFNNTKVIQARLNFTKDTGANIEIFCLNPVKPDNYEAAFKKKGSCVWNCMAGNLKKWKTNIIQKEFLFEGLVYRLTAKKLKREGNRINIEFKWDNNKLSFADILEITGVTPLPPYIKRKAVKSDKERYQTIYSKYYGSVAAPTAGLHMSENVITDLKSKNINLVEITLHVGADTFQPVKEKYANDHMMHSEPFIINIDAMTALRNNPDRIIALGTTTVRTLESLYWLGVKIKQDGISGNEITGLGQWEPYNLRQDVDRTESLNSIIAYMKSNGIDRLIAETRFMIVPGYKFRLAKGIITNFHLPKSTLLLLVAAFAGDSWRDIYSYALKNDFRFLSYGDCSLLIRD
jgi:S-adenosylmethionine:tRNA ribosyltransferase-isomerase